MNGEHYLVPRSASEITLTEKRSRFIGVIQPVESESQALDSLQKLRACHRNATHNVYAYVIRDDNIVRYSDDGEPQGTAGMPVLEVLRREQIFNVLCVVTRYFGGVLLGAAGLTRIYAATAKAALDAAGIATKRRWTSVKMTCPYPLWSRVKLLVAEADGLEEEVDFAADVSLTMSLPSPNLPNFAENIRSLSAGKVVLEVCSETFRAL